MRKMKQLLVAGEWGACAAGGAIYNGSPTPLRILGFLGNHDAPRRTALRLLHGRVNEPLNVPSVFSFTQPLLQLSAKHN